MKTYDFIFGIGRACACSQALRKAGLQMLSLPWDWVVVHPLGGRRELPVRLDVMESGFEDWLREEDLEFVSSITATGKDLYRNRRYGIAHPHDFPLGVPLHESYPAAKAKYDRRVARFQRLMAESRTCVLAVCVDTPVAPKAEIDECREAQRRLQALYPHVKVDFLLISLEDGRSFADRATEDLGDGLTRIAFDFKDRSPGKFDFSVQLDKLAAVMKSIASVREYRSPAEIKAMNERTRQEKMREQGAKNAWEYFLIRRRRELARLRDLMIPRMILSRIRSRKYDHVLSLGMNCEPAFRFSLSWGGVESTPFSWSLCSDLRSLAEILRHPELTGSEGFSFVDTTLMWRCNRTGISFHGKQMLPVDASTTAPELLAADKADLAQRLAYLNKKLTRILSDESSKAIIFRVHSHLVRKDDINERIDAVQQALEARGARNYTLVVVTERAVRERIASAPNRVVRSVKAFNPSDAVLNPKLGDPIGWKALYAEFAPRKILPKKHAFKFEKH